MEMKRVAIWRVLVTVHSVVTMYLFELKNVVCGQSTIVFGLNPRPEAGRRTRSSVELAIELTGTNLN